MLGRSSFRLSALGVLALVAAACGADVRSGSGESDEGGGSDDGAGGRAYGDSDKPRLECEPYQTQSCGPDDMTDGAWTQHDRWCTEGEEGWVWGECCAHPFDNPCVCDPDPNCYTPLVLSFDDRPVAYTDEVRAAFDLTGLGVCTATDWPTASTPWIALDRDGSGTIDDGSELFGSATRLAAGALARNGFEALAELDGDHDRRITPADGAWASIQIWRDADADRRTSANELSGLSEAGVRWIDLAYRIAPRCDLRGNCEIERARFGYLDPAGHEHEGAVIDVHLRRQMR